MNNMKKRLILFLIVFLLLQITILALPMTVSAEEEGTTKDETNQFVYEPIKTEYGIFNRYNYQDRDFFKFYNRHSFNTITEFVNQITDLRLEYLKIYFNLEGKFIWEDFAYTVDEATGERVKTIYSYLATPQQKLMASLSALLENDYHTHGDWWHGTYETVGYQGAFVERDNYYPFARVSGLDFADKKQDMSATLGLLVYKEIYPNPYKGKPGWENYEDELQYPNLNMYIYEDSYKDYACKDGNPFITNLSLTFADIKDPKITKIYTVDKDGKADNLFRAGEPIYLKVEFDEPVRFSDNVANDHGIEIKMMDSNNNELTGKITAVKDKYMIIKYENTSVSDDFVFTQVDLSPLLGDQLWDLKDIFGEKGKREFDSLLDERFRSVTDGSNNVIKYGYDKSLCLITDIAGNPLELQKDSQGNPLKKQVYSIYRNCYLDGVAPKVEDIYYTKNMYNSDVKEKLGTQGMTDPSDLNAGPGDKITYYVTFNENMFADGKSMIGYSSKIAAVLNVKKPGTDENVTLGVWNISNPSPGVIDPKYKEAKTTVQFEEFVVTEGMECEDDDGKIRIKEIIVRGASVTDMSGNAYDGKVNKDLNDNPIEMDLTKPEITTNITPSENVYTPVYLSGNKKQFYFPIMVTDKNGTNLLDGTFSWVNGISGEKDYKFQYAVTTSNENPAEEYWKTGYTGQFYSFTQIESGNYIHIRLFDDVQYNLGFTRLNIKPKDYAGNIGDQSFSLDFSIDTGLPSASVVSTSKKHDLDAGGVFITVNVNATDDNSGIKEVYYLWTDTGSAQPSENSEGWKEAPGTYQLGDNAVQVKAVTDRITGSYTGVLYVMPVDMVGNKRIIRLGTFTHTDTAPQYDLQYSTEITAEAKLNISGITEDSAVVVMIKKPGTTDNYYVSVIDQDGYNWDILNNKSYGSEPITDLYSWGVYEVTAQGQNSYKFKFLRSPNVDSIDMDLKDIIEGNYYGEIEITLLAGESPKDPSKIDVFDPDFNPEIDLINGAFKYKFNGRLLLDEAGTESGGPVISQNITLKAAAGQDGVYEVNITTSDVLDKLINYRRDRQPFTSSLPFNPDDSADRMLSTLEGVKVNVTIKNLKVNDWGIDDIDFKNSYIIVRRATDQYLRGYDGNECARINLEQQAIQTIPLPAASSGYYPSGRYQLDVVLKAKASGEEYTFTFDNFTYGENNSIIDGGIFVDSTPESDKFGFAGYSYDVSNGEYGINEKNTRYYGPVYGVTDDEGNPLTYSASNNTVIRIPVNSGDEFLSSVALYFTVDDMPDKSEIEGDGYVDIIGARAIKAWNETEGVDDALSKVNAMWYYALDATDDEGSKNSSYIVRFVDKAGDVVNAYGKSEDFAYLPLIKNTVNTIAFQVVNANGKVSEKRTVFIEPIDAQVSGTVSMTDTNKPVKEGKLTFKPGPNQSTEGVTLYAYDRYTGKPPVDMTENYDLYDNSYSFDLIEPGFHKYYIYTRDKYGNYTLLGSKEWDMTDDGPPIVVDPELLNDDSGDDGQSGNEPNDSEPGNNADLGYFTARYAFEEFSFAYGMEQTLKLYFDKDYMKLLGFDNNVSGSASGEAFTLKLSRDIIINANYNHKAVYEVDEPNKFGIYKVDAEIHTEEVENGQKEWLIVTAYGINKYDSSLEEGAKVTRTLYATLTDPFGYESDPEAGKQTFELTNTKPKYVTGYITEYDTLKDYTLNGIDYTLASWRFDAEFNTHVRLDKSLATEDPSGYSMIKSGELPVYRDGNYMITFYDIFGTKWTQEIVVEKQFNEFGLLISLSETGATKNSVDVTVIPEYIEDEYCTVTESSGSTIGYSNETINIDSNGRYYVMVINPKKQIIAQVEFYITNILRDEPNAELHWYYHEFGSDTPPEGLTKTSQPVTVWYTADRKVSPTNGTTAIHTFYPDNGITEYTFEFMDEAGNTGSITAILPITMEEPEEPVVDKAKPKYDIRIYAKKDGKEEFRAEYRSVNSEMEQEDGMEPEDKMELEDAIREAGYVQGYVFDIIVTEDSPYKILLLKDDTDVNSVSYNSESTADIEGVSLSRNRITVTKPATFKVVIVDKFNNMSFFRMDLGKYFDTTAPTAKITEYYSDFYKVKLYAELEDLADNGDKTHETYKVTLLSPTGLSFEDGKYYFEFTENRSLTLYFVDSAGNIGSETIEVNSLDLKKPEVVDITWSPCLINPDDGSQNPALPPNRLTNKDVTAIVKYDKPVVVTASVSFDGGENWQEVIDDTYDDYFELKATSDIAKVTFHSGGFGVKLTATALNNRTYEMVLHLENVIVKTEPKIKKEVSYIYRSGYESGTPVSVTITLTPESIDVYCAEYATPKQVTENAKSKEVIKKGESISFTVSRKGNYTYHFTDVAGNTSTVTVYVEKELDQTPPVITVNNKDLPVTNEKVSVPITLNEDGKLTVICANNTKIFDDYVSGNVQTNVTIDNNGTYEVIAVDKAGNTANSVFSVGNIDKIAPVITLDPITVDIRQDSDEDALKALLDVGCIVTDNRSVKIDVTYKSDNVDLTVPGVYTVTYEAKDEVGNIGKATRFVRVYSKDELEVLINGKKTYYGGTATVKLNELKITINNPVGNEPYTIYLSSSLRSEGQMKYNHTIIRPDSQRRFSVPSPGFYTLYIVTQSRQTYLIRLNVIK